MADALDAIIDGGTGNAIIRFFTGTQPASAATAASGTLLATLTLNDPAFASAIIGSKAANSITSDTSIDATGTVGWFRVYNAAAPTDPTDAVFDGEVTETGGGGQITFGSVNWEAGETASISSFNFVVPASQA